MKKRLLTIIGIILVLVGGMLTACSDPYAKMKIVANYENQSQGYLSINVGEEADITFVIENFPKNGDAQLFLRPGSNNITASLKSYNNTLGTAVVTVKALSFGDSTLTVISAQKSTVSTQVQIKTILAIDDFKLKDNASLFAVRGTNNPLTLELNSSFFEFTPKDTTQKDLIFKDATGKEITKIDPKDYEGQSFVTVFATSPYLPRKEVIMTVQIIDEISFVDVYLSSENKKIISKEQATEQTPSDKILFISNRDNEKYNFSRKILDVVIKGNPNSLIRISRSVEKTIVESTNFDTSTKREGENGDIIFPFTLHSKERGATTISFQVYYEGYESYKITRTFDILVESAPKQILMDVSVGNEELEENSIVTLYDGAFTTVYSIQKISIAPIDAIFDRFEVSYDLSELNDPNANISTYINFTYGGAPLGNVLTNINLPIIAKGLKNTNGKIIYMVLKVFWGEKEGIVHDETPIEYRLGFEVKTGADALLIDSKYHSPDGIYVDLNGGTKEFKGFYVASTQAYTESLKIYSVTQGAGLFAKIEESPNLYNPNYTIIENRKIVPINITPLAVGTGTWRIVLPNGVLREIKVNVVSSLSNVALTIDESQSSQITLKTRNENGSLTDVGVKLSYSDGNYIANLKIDFITSPIKLSQYSTNLYTLEVKPSTTAGAENFVTIDSAQRLVKITTNEDGFVGEVLTYTLTVKKVEDFLLVDESYFEEGSTELEQYLKQYQFKGSLRAQAFLPLQGVRFSQEEISVYSESRLGYYYKDLSQAHSKLIFEPAEIEGKSSVKIELSASIASQYDSANKVLNVGGYGIYDLKTSTFYCDVSATEYITFNIFAIVSYYGEVYTATLKVITNEYIDVSGVRLENYIKEIYLDPTHPSEDIWTYVLPVNAIHKELVYIFIPEVGVDSNIVTVESSPAEPNKVRVSYNNRGGGRGELVISPRSSIKDPSLPASNALRIKIRVGDGSENAPFNITTAQGLLAIGQNGLDKHYTITTTIDLENQTFMPLGELTGSINGLGTGKIIGIKVSNSVNGYAGLFTKISGSVKNLVLEGSIQLQAKQESKIGLLAGEISGLVQNVSVFLNQSTVEIINDTDSATPRVEVGALAGRNTGKILTQVGGTYNFGSAQIKYNNYSLVVMNGTFNLLNKSKNELAKSYFGGVVGINDETGIIEKLTVDNVKLYNQENYIITINMNLAGHENVSNSYPNLNFDIGGIAGQNNGKIVANVLNVEYDANHSNYIKVSGKIRIFQAKNRLGGLVGYNIGANAEISRVVSRVYLVSTGESFGADSYIGGLFGYNNGASVKNCLIQAVEDGVSTNENITMIRSTYGLKEGTTQTELSGKVNIIGYDALTSSALQTKQDVDSLASSSVFNLTAESFVAYDENLNPLGRRKVDYVENASLGINEYFGDFLVGTTEKYIGICFEAKSASIISNPENTVNKMEGSETDLLMSYQFFYKAVDSSKQSYLNNVNIVDFPFDFSGEIILMSLNPAVISITSNGKLNINSTGIASIIVLSALNRKVAQQVYVYVVGAVDGFNLYHSQSTERISQLEEGIYIYGNNSYPISAIFTKEDVNIDNTGYYVAVQAGNEFEIINTQTPNPGILDTVELIKNGNVYLLKPINGFGTTKLQLQAKLTLTTQNGKTYTSSDFLKNSQGNPIAYVLIAHRLAGSTAVIPNIDQTTVEPADKFNFEVDLQTDAMDDELTIGTSKVVSNGIEPSSKNDHFNIVETNRVYTFEVSPNYLKTLPNKFKLVISQTNTLSNEIQKTEFLLEVDETRTLIKGQGNFAKSIQFDMSQLFTIDPTQKYTYSFEIFLNPTEVDQIENYTVSIKNASEVFEDLPISEESMITLKNIKFFYEGAFNIEKYNTNYGGKYYINFTPKRGFGIFGAIEVNVLVQKVMSIELASFNGASKDDINSGKTQTNYIDPGSPNHFRIQVFPSFADYDFVEIVVTEKSKDFTTLLTWINADGTNKQGAIIVNNGIRINKDKVIASGNILYVKYDISSVGVENGDIIVYTVRTYKNGSINHTVSKTITVKFSKDVTISIEGKTPNKDGFVYLTRGGTYNFKVNSVGYLDKEIFINTTRPDLVSINFTTKTISIAQTIIYPTNQEGVIGQIQIYGKKIVNGEEVTSAVDSLDFILVDYFISESTSAENNNLLVKNGSNGIIQLSLGNTYIFDVQFLNGLNIEYNSSIASVRENVQILAQNLKNNVGAWQYQMGSLNEQGEYIYGSNWINIVGSVSAVSTNDYFTITVKQNNFVFTPLKINNASNPAYKFRFNYSYIYQSGQAIVLSINENNFENVRSEEFCFNIYQLSSIDSPTPIYTAEEFMAMGDGAYYILLNDIVLPSNFTPITASIAGFDGNSKKIIITSNLSFNVSGENLGIFATIAENALVRNVTIEIANTSRLTINQSSALGVNFGILAGENRGSITNCFVKTVSGVSFRVVFSSTVSGVVNYVGGLVGRNNGYITNSRVSLNITSASNLAGLVAINNGIVASSYVYNSLIVNASTEGISTNKTAGFAIINGIVNNSGGKILTSYVTGVHTGVPILSMYANDQNKIIRSSTETAGFVFENNGLVENSYSNIPISTSAKSAGFVFINKGTISNAYSTSLLKENSQESYGFIYDKNEGSLKNTFYLSDQTVNRSINPSNELFNVSELQKLSREDFGRLQTDPSFKFTTYAFSSTSEVTKGIWFLPQTEYQGQFNNPDKQFVIGRPELVPTNIIIEPELELDADATFEDQTTGKTTYVYRNISNSPQGSLYNPYIISSAKLFEERILETSIFGVNTNNFRIVSILDYENENMPASKLHTITLTGDIEGNGMEIRGYVIENSQTLGSAGLFAQIGNGSLDQGSVKNLVLRPKYINLPNTLSVGALAGTLDSGNLFNITVDGYYYSNTGIVIVGRNIVGGVIGRAIGNYKIYNVSSSVSTNATYRSETTLGQGSTNSNQGVGSYFLFKTHRADTLSKLSYSGGIAGILAGQGEVIYSSISKQTASIAEFAGLFYGGIGNAVTVENLTAHIVDGQYVNASVYGGIVAGESYGNIINATINSANQEMEIFKSIPFVPKAVGGLVGLMGFRNNLANPEVSQTIGGLIKNSVVKAKINTPSILVIGGLVGEMIGGGQVYYDGYSGLYTSGIVASGFVGSIYGLQTVGGIIGRIAISPTADIRLDSRTLQKVYDTGLAVEGKTTSMHITHQVYSKDGTLSVSNDNMGRAYIGGIVGEMYLPITKDVTTTNTNFVFNNTYSSINIKAKVDIYGTEFNVYTAGIVGLLNRSHTDNFRIGIKFEYVFYSGKIELELKDLKGAPNPVTSYRIYYGEIISFAFGDEVMIEEVHTYFKPGNPQYDGQGGYYKFLLRYYSNGQLITYNPNSSEILIRQGTEIIGTPRENQAIPFGQNGFSSTIWVQANPTTNFPWLRIEK